MKCIIVAALALCIILSVSSLGQDMTGKMKAGGYLGYTLGMGDAFQNTDAGICLGGQFYYGWKENLMIGGELMLQSYGHDGGGGSTELNILANGLYVMNYDDETAFFLTGGAGFYDFGGMKLGLNGGIVYRKMVSPTMAVFGSPRFHVIFADGTPMLIQLAIGVEFPLGEKK